MDPILREQFRHPVYMTNGCCEPIDESKPVLDALGLPVGQWNGDWYPLTKEEEQFIGEDEAGPTPTGWWARMSYSVIYRGRKWVSLDIEYSWGRAEVLRTARQAADEMWRDVELFWRHLGRRPQLPLELFVTQDDSDRFHTLAVLLPLDWLRANVHATPTMDLYNVYKQMLTQFFQQAKEQ
jgi:hypothetical protein